MSRSKLGPLGLCVIALGLMALAAGSASAAEWLILNGKGEVKTAGELNAAVEGEFEFSTDGTLLTKLVGISLSVLCTDFITSSGASLKGGGTLASGGEVIFTGCTVPVPVGKICTVKSVGAVVGIITSLALKGQLQSNGEILIEPTTPGGPLAKLLFEGEECTLPTGVAEPINGVLWVKDCEGKVETHLVKHLIEESKAKFGKNKKGVLSLGTLWIGKDTEEHLETSIDGSAFAFLTGGTPTHSGLSWGATLP